MTNLASLKQHKKLLEKAKLFKVEERELTFFDTAIRNHYENPTTELLAFFLNPKNKHGLDHCFFNGLIDALSQLFSIDLIENVGDIVDIQTEVDIPSGGRIDLLIQTDNAVIVVESKIYHHQLNPFTSYTKYAKDIARDRQIIPVIFCIDGKSLIDGWSGLSFEQFTAAVESQLGQALVTNPYNKWGLFAREFLLHLNSFEKDKINMETFNFVVNNLKEISEIIDLKDQMYSQLVSHINQNLEEGIEGYEAYHRRHTWSGTPAFRFANNKWTTWSDIVLNLNIKSSPLTCKINLYIENQTPELVKIFKQELQKEG
ncbi:MAG: PD-(D/E)XK nuclease family protein, partial [Gammaproteobacteria bacterium]|nr:PD-(D/E)XK nuclease family protein [Gammaproteobacteria bacterium]